MPGIFAIPNSFATVAPVNAGSTPNGTASVSGPELNRLLKANVAAKQIARLGKDDSDLASSFSEQFEIQPDPGLSTVTLIGVFIIQGHINSLADGSWVYNIPTGGWWPFGFPGFAHAWAGAFGKITCKVSKGATTIMEFASPFRVESESVFLSTGRNKSIGFIDARVLQVETNEPFSMEMTVAIGAASTVFLVNQGLSVSAGPPLGTPARGAKSRASVSIDSATLRLIAV